jgi:hypothetical protein
MASNPFAPSRKKVLRWSETCWDATASRVSNGDTTAAAAKNAPPIAASFQTGTEVESCAVARPTKSTVQTKTHLAVVPSGDSSVAPPGSVVHGRTTADAQGRRILVTLLPGVDIHSDRIVGILCVARL